MTRRLSLAWLVLAPAAALLALAMTGGLAAQAVVGLPDPGSLTRVGLPLTQAVRDLASALTVGALVLASVVAPPAPGGGRRDLSGPRQPLLTVAVRAAAVWSLSGLVLLTLTYSDVTGTPFGAAGFADQVLFFATRFDVGTYLLWSTALAGVVCVGGMLVQRVTGIGVLAVLGLAGLWPLALTGHAAGTLNHDKAVDLLMMHLVGIAIWFGGLAALVITRGHWGEALPVAARRFSRLAGASLALVVVSGVLGAVLRVSSLEAITSSYGAMLALKTGAVVALALIGMGQRRRWVRDLAESRPRAFWRGVLVEVCVMAATVGLGVALSRTGPPTPNVAPEPLTAAEALTGAALPPALGAQAWFTQWAPDTVWIPVAAFLLLAYLGGVLRLRRRGDRWAVGRTLAWSTGVLLLAWSVSGAPGVYGRVLFSMHMVQHMTIATAVPVLLVLGAPVTLAVRAIAARSDRSMGAREWLLVTVHGWPARLLSFPIVAGGLFVVSLVVFYYSSLLETSLKTHTGHQLMVAHFLLVGYLLASCLVGIDPGPPRPAYPMRMLLLMVTFGFHALFSVSLMASGTVLAENWFGALGRDWGPSLADDQYVGASLGWLLGDYPLAILAGALIVRWVQSDRRERRRFDRHEERHGDPQLTSYNARLQALGGAADVAPETSPPEPPPGSPEPPPRSTA